MKKLRMMGIISIALLFGMVFIACKQEALSSDASLNGISVAGVAATLGTPSSDWKAGTPGDVYLTESQLVDATVSVSTVDSDAIVYYAATNSIGLAPSFVESSTFTFQYEDCLFVEVFSANQDAFLIYKVFIHLIKPTVTEFTVNQQVDGWSADGKGNVNLGVNTVSRTAVLGIPADTPDAAAQGELIIGASQAGKAFALTASTELSTTILKYAKASTGFAVVESLTLANNDIIYIEATAEDGTTKFYYKVKVVVKSDAGLGSLSIAGQLIAERIPGSTYANTGVSKVITVSGASDLVSVAISATSLAGGNVPTITYGTSHVIGTEPESWSSSPLANIPNGDYIGIKVVSDIGTNYYKYRIAWGSSLAVITGATVSGVTATTGTPGAALDGALLAGAGTVTLTTAAQLENVNAIVLALGISANATVAYNYFTYAEFFPGFGFATEGPAWGDGTNVFPYIAAGNGPYGPTPEVPAGIPEAGANIAIRVTSENGMTVNYYAIKVVYTP
jgi:hypothetical protein